MTAQRLDASSACCKQTAICLERRQEFFEQSEQHQRQDRKQALQLQQNHFVKLKRLKNKQLDQLDGIRSGLEHNNQLLSEQNRAMLRQNRAMARQTAALNDLIQVLRDKAKNPGTLPSIVTPPPPPPPPPPAAAAIPLPMIQPCTPPRKTRTACLLQEEALGDVAASPSLRGEYFEC